MNEDHHPVGRPWPLGGYASGNYTCKCVRCGNQFEGDKRAYECLECAARQVNAARRAANTPVDGVSVKPLEWQQPTGPWTFVAKVLNLEYRVSEGFGEDATWGLRLFNTLVGTYADSEEAKAAAQADFNARIQACLTSPAAKPVAHFAKPTQPGHGWMHVPDEWAGREGVVPLYTHPSSPVSAEVTVTDEMVKRALEAYFPDGTYGIHRRMADDVQSVVFDHMRAALTAALEGAK